MPLSSRDRKFLHAIDRLKIYLLLIALVTLIYLLFLPSGDIQMATSVIGIALCGMFWLTHRLLSFISLLDLELTRIINILRRTLPAKERKELLIDE